MPHVKPPTCMPAEQTELPLIYEGPDGKQFFKDYPALRDFSPNGYVHTDIFEPLARELWTRLNCKDPLTVKFIETILVAISVFDRKQRSYGSDNIASFGTTGVLVRISDKISRLRNLWKKKSEQPAGEPIIDSFFDNGVYSFIALMCENGRWPGVVPETTLSEKA